MPSAELVAIADAITTELAAAQVAGHFVDLDSFTPERSYADWQTELTELDALLVDVVPVHYEESELETRGRVRYLCSVDVAVRRYFPVQDSEGPNNRIKRAKVDRLVLFVQELHEFFCRDLGRRLAAYPDASWHRTRILATCSKKHLREHRMFRGVLRTEYSAGKVL